MSLFQCYECGCRENTATSNFWVRMSDSQNYQWRGKPSEPWMLCSACDPKIRKWHDLFDRQLLPRGKFITNNQGNLEHVDTGQLCHEWLTAAKAAGN